MTHQDWQKAAASFKPLRAVTGGSRWSLWSELENKVTVTFQRTVNFAVSSRACATQLEPHRSLAEAFSSVLCVFPIS